MMKREVGRVGQAGKVAVDPQSPPQADIPSQQHDPQS